MVHGSLMALVYSSRKQERKDCRAVHLVTFYCVELFNPCFINIQISPLAFNCPLLPKRDSVSSMSRSITRSIRRIAVHSTILSKITILRTFASGLSERPSMTQPAEETRNVKDMDRLLEIIRASTDRHVVLEVF